MVSSLVSGELLRRWPTDPHSFVIKKKGLLASTAKAGNAAGEGHAYLKSWMWWTGMILMIIGEILNFVA